MKVKQLIFLVCICLRHGINPLKRNCNNKDKYQSRLTEREKKWVVQNCHESARDYFTKLMYKEVEEG